MDGIIICGVNLSLIMQKEKKNHSSVSQWINSQGDDNDFYAMNLTPPATSLTHVCNAKTPIILTTALTHHFPHYSKTGKERTSNWLCLQLTGDCKPPAHRVLTGGISHTNRECSCVPNNLLVLSPKALNYSATLSMYCSWVCCERTNKSCSSITFVIITIGFVG